MDHRKRRIRDIFGGGGGGGGGAKLPRFEPEHSLFDKTLDCNTLAVVIENMSVRQIANFAATNQHVAHCMKQLAKFPKFADRFELVGLVNARERCVRDTTNKVGRPETWLLNSNAPTHHDIVDIIILHAFRPLHSVFTPKYADPETNVLIERFLNLGRNVFKKVMEFWFTLPMQHVPFSFSRPDDTMKHPLTTVQKFHVGAVMLAAKEVYHMEETAEEANVPFVRPDFLNEKQYELLWTLGFILDYSGIFDMAYSYLSRVMIRPLDFGTAGTVAFEQIVPAFNKAVECIIDNRDLASDFGETPDDVDFMRLVELLSNGCMDFDVLRLHNNYVKFWKADQDDELQEYCNQVRQRFGPEHAQAMSKIRMDDRKINEAVAEELESGSGDAEIVLDKVLPVRPSTTIQDVIKRLEEMEFVLFG